MDEQLAKHLGKHLAKVATSRIASSSKLGNLWGALHVNDRHDFLETMAEGMAEALRAGTLEEQDDLIKVVAAAMRSWAGIADRVLYLWREDIGDSVVPTWGPLAGNTVECVCKGEAEDCPWCENCGKLTPAVRDLILRVQGEPDSVATGPHGDPAQAVLDMLLATRERGVRSVEVGNGEGGSVKVEFEPRGEPPGRLCSECMAWMRPSVAEGQLQWTCPVCSRVEAKSR
jgi:hypothetical protein